MAYTPEGTPRQSQAFDRKADAIQWTKQHETAAQTGRHLISQEAWKRTLADRGLGARRLDRGSYYLSDISPRMIDDCKQKLLRQPGPRGKRSNSTINRYLTTLSAA